MEKGKVVLLLTAPTKGEPMQRHQRLQLLPGLGIPGDRYATKSGHWSDAQWPDQELTLVEAELALELEVEPALLRRNIVTQGVKLDDLIGREFMLGTALLRGMRTCDPCRYLESITRPGIFAELDGRGGLRAAVLRKGSVAVGDTLNARTDSAPQPSRVAQERRRTENGIKHSAMRERA